MYPARELNQLLDRKTVLRKRISRRREECAACAATVLRPLAWLDWAQRLWQLRPVWTAAATAFGKNWLFAASSGGWLRKALRFAPLIWNAWRAFSGARGKAASG